MNKTNKVKRLIMFLKNCINKKIKIKKKFVYFYYIIVDVIVLVIVLVDLKKNIILYKKYKILEKLKIKILKK